MNKIYAVIGRRNIDVYIGTEEFEYSHWNCEIIEVKLFKWLPNNHLQIIGLKQDWQFNSRFIQTNERNIMINNVEEEFIKNNKLFWFKWKSLLEGYVRMKKRIPFDKTFVNFRVTMHNK